MGLSAHYREIPSLTRLDEAIRILEHEAAAIARGHDVTGSRDDNWAKPVNRLEVKSVPEGAKGQTVHGRRLTGPLQGFGQMWQKTYRVRIDGKNPEGSHRGVEASYGRFWPKTDRFYAPIAGIKNRARSVSSPVRGTDEVVDGSDGALRRRPLVHLHHAGGASVCRLDHVQRPRRRTITIAQVSRPDQGERSRCGGLGSWPTAAAPKTRCGFTRSGHSPPHLGSKYKPTFERVG